MCVDGDGYCVWGSSQGSEIKTPTAPWRGRNPTELSLWFSSQVWVNLFGSSTWAYSGGVLLHLLAVDQRKKIFSLFRFKDEPDWKIALISPPSPFSEKHLINFYFTTWYVCANQRSIIQLFIFIENWSPIFFKFVFPPKTNKCWRKHVFNEKFPGESKPLPALL